VLFVDTGIGLELHPWYDSSLQAVEENRAAAATVDGGGDHWEYFF
jgi:hypothetical protein